MDAETGALSLSVYSNRERSAGRELAEPSYQYQVGHSLTILLLGITAIFRLQRMPAGSMVGQDCLPTARVPILSARDPSDQEPAIGRGPTRTGPPLLGWPRST